MPWTANMVGARVSENSRGTQIFFQFFWAWVPFLINNTIIPLTFVGYEIVIANARSWLKYIA